MDPYYPSHVTRPGATVHRKRRTSCANNRPYSCRPKVGTVVASKHASGRRRDSRGRPYSRQRYYTGLYKVRIHYLTVPSPPLRVVVEYVFIATRRLLLRMSLADSADRPGSVQTVIAAAHRGSCSCDGVTRSTCQVSRTNGIFTPQFSDTKRT